MLIDREGKEVDVAFIPDGQKLFEMFRVRVIRDKYNDKGKRVKREVVGEEDYKEYPTDEQKMYCIAKHQGDFCVTEKISTLEWIPFSEDMNCNNCRYDESYCEMRLCPRALELDAIELEHPGPCSYIDDDGNQVVEVR